MEAVYFTTACKEQRKPYHFCNVCPFSDYNVSGRFKDFGTFRYVFMSVDNVFVCLELWVNVTVASFQFQWRITECVMLWRPILTTDVEGNS